MTELEEFEKIIEYEFKDKSLLRQSLIHSSYANDYLGDSTLCNERLEFLGDAILDAAVGAKLFELYPKEQEGFLSKLRSEIVCEASLAKIAFDKGMNEYIKLGRGEEAKGGRNRASIISDLVEAVIAAVYLDGGLEESWRFTLRLMEPVIEKAESGDLPKDNKTLFQEYCQKKNKRLPKYRILEESGPDHNKLFEAGVFLDDRLIAKGQGKTKKEAEAAAAAEALKQTEE